MYKIKTQDAVSFITDNIVLPRFQRKQTWNEIKNFQLCISIFKGYPLGVCILNVENEKIKNKSEKKYLLDGRQRRNALLQMYENPEVIGFWAKKFLKFKNNIDLNDLKDLFNEKVNEYLETDEEYDEEDDENLAQEVDELEDEEYDEIDDSGVSSLGEDGLSLLCKIIILTYKQTKHATGFSSPFDFSKALTNLPYLDQNEKNGYLINGIKLKTFITEFRSYCRVEDIEYMEKWEDFVDFTLKRSQLKDVTKRKSFEATIQSRWSEIKERLELVENLEAIMRSCEIGIIEVSEFKPADSQKIFNIINSEGVKLTAVEILSAKTYWNRKINNPSAEMLSTAQDLYRNMGIKIDSVFRWDVPATLLSRLGENVVFKNLSWDSKNKKTEFEKKLTLGFKIFSGIYENGITKEDIDNMGKDSRINWDTMTEETVSDIKCVLKLIEQISYFKFLKSWGTTIMELTSDAIALDFILLTYFDWKNKNSPIGASKKTKQFQKNCFILWDQLIYEYVKKMWRGSSDSMIANNIKSLKTNYQDGDMLAPVKEEQWKELLKEIRENSKVNGADVSVSLMKPLLYHMYCLKGIQGPGVNYSIDVDHILPQSAFESSIILSKDTVKDNLFNLGLLPKKDNISKSNKYLNEINDTWLRSQIEKYEFIKVEQYESFSKISNYEDLFDYKKKAYDEAFSSDRENILMN